MTLTYSSRKSLHAFTVLLLYWGIVGLSRIIHTFIAVISVPLPQHISLIWTETSKLSLLHLIFLPLLFILPSTTLKPCSIVPFETAFFFCFLETAFLIPAFPLYPQSSEFL